MPITRDIRLLAQDEARLGRRAPDARFGLKIRGIWRDVFTLEDGRQVICPWKENQIQNLAATLAAALFARAEHGVTFTGMTGITYMAVGSGEVSWDTTPPVLDAAGTTLTTEYYRKAIPVTELVFLDPALPPGSPPIAGPSRKIGTTVTFLTAEGNGDMREFALFGGLADGVANSGTIINWVSHPLIPKDTSLTLARTVELEFLLP